MKTSLKFTRLTLASASMLALFGFSEAANAATQTFSVPVQFSLQLTPPSCTLSVGTLSTNSTTVPTATAIPLPIGSTSLTPASYITNNFTAAASGGTAGWSSGQLTGGTTGATPLVPTAFANCTLGTPYSISVTNDPSGATVAGSTFSSVVTGQVAVGVGTVTPNLTSLGMYMGVISVAGNTSSTQSGSAYATPASVAATGTGANQTIVLEAVAVASNSGVGVAAFGSGSAGTYTYKFLTNLIF